MQLPNSAAGGQEALTLRAAASVLGSLGSQATHGPFCRGPEGPRKIRACVSLPEPLWPPVFCVCVCGSGMSLMPQNLPPRPSLSLPFTQPKEEVLCVKLP